MNRDFSTVITLVITLLPSLKLEFGGLADCENGFHSWVRPMDLKDRAMQVWGYLALIVGCGLAMVQVVALTSPRRLDLRVFFLIVVLAAYLIRIGVRSIDAARRIEGGLSAVTFSDEVRALWVRSRSTLSGLPQKMGRVGITRKAFLVVLGVGHAIAGVLAFLYVGGVILAVAAYLGIGPLAVPILIFCLVGTVVGITMAVRPSVVACRAIAVWDALVGLFFLQAALKGSNFHTAPLIIAAFFLAMFAVLIIPNTVK